MRLEIGIMFDNKPEDVVVYPKSVYVVKSCEEIQVTDEPEGAAQTKYQCDVEVYEIAEYIDKLGIENKTLEMKLELTQSVIDEILLG